MGPPSEMVTQVGQILISCTLLALLGIVVVLDPGSTYLPVLLTMAGSIVGFWLGGQTSRSGAATTNGTLEKLLTLVQQQHAAALDAVPREVEK